MFFKLKQELHANVLKSPVNNCFRHLSESLPRVSKF